MAGFRLSAGVRYMLAAAFFFSLMSLLVKIVGQRLPSSEVVLARSVLSLVFTYVMLRRAGVALWGNRKGLLTFRGLAGFFSLLCAFYAIPRLPLADVTVIVFTYPLFVALFAALFLREPFGLAEMLSMGVSLTGIAFIAKPSFLFHTTVASLDLMAVGLALLGAICAAAAHTTVRKLGETEHHLVVVFYLPLVSIPASLPVMATGAFWPTPLEWLLLLGVGVTTQFAQVYQTKGLHALPAGRASAMRYVEILFALVWGMLFFAEYPDGWSLFGALMVVGGTLLMIRLRR